VNAIWPQVVPLCWNIFLEISTRDTCQHFGGKSWANMALSRTKTVTMKLTKKAAVKLFDHTPITYWLSREPASCNLENEFRHFVPHVIHSYNQFSTPEKENAHRHHFHPSRSFFYRDILLVASWAQFGGGHGGRDPPTFLGGGHNLRCPPTFSLQVSYLEKFQKQKWRLPRFVWSAYHVRCYT